MSGRIVVTVHATQTRSPLFSMGVASALCGLHPQTLRQYERHGLVSPQRTTGGTRLYSEADLHRAARIAELSDSGVSLSGVGIVLALEDENRALRAEIDRLKSRRPGR